MLSAKSKINWRKRGLELELSGTVSLKRKYLNRGLRGDGEGGRKGWWQRRNSECQGSLVALNLEAGVPARSAL